MGWRGGWRAELAASCSAGSLGLQLSAAQVCLPSVVLHIFALLRRWDRSRTAEDAWAGRHLQAARIDMRGRFKFCVLRVRWVEWSGLRPILASLLCKRLAAQLCQHPTALGCRSAAPNMWPSCSALLRSDGAGHTRFVVRGRAGATSATLLAEVNAEAAAASRSAGASPATVEVVGDGVMEW